MAERQINYAVKPVSGAPNIMPPVTTRLQDARPFNDLNKTVIQPATSSPVNMVDQKIAGPPVPACNFKYGT